MSKSIGILVFDGAEELDFVGPWEVFTMTNEVLALSGKPAAHEVKLVAERDTPVTCAKGLRVLPDLTVAQCERLDVLLIPGGQGTRREVKNEALLTWIAAVSRHCEWVTSVCTGALLLTAAGPAKGKRVTTHWAFVEQLRARKRGGRGGGTHPLCARRQRGDGRRRVGRHRYGAVAGGADARGANGALRPAGDRV